MTSNDHCADCGAILPLDRPMFRAANNRGVRCEKCELVSAGKQEVERLRAQQAQQESAR